MHKLSRRSVSSILRSTGSVSRYGGAATAVPFSDSVIDGEAKFRWYSNLIRHHPSPSVGEKYEYQAEVSRLMDLIVNSLYSNKEVFLRELISNASDALDKLRFLSVTDSELLKDASDLDIRIQTDKDNGIIHIIDSGIGMTRQELIDCLGTIAQSGTAKFLKALKDSKDAGADNNLIGQFGVGFYSAFLVADRVVVSTKSPRSDKQYVWEGEANASSYTIREDTDPENHIPRGTRLTLYLKRDDKGFAHPERIQKLVKNYSQFVSFPIYTWQEKGYTKEVEVDEDPAEAKKDEQDDTTENKKKTKTVVEKYWDWELSNETQPIWLRNPKEVSTEEYNEFYKKTFNEYLEPLASSHFTTEGEVEFRSILYVPAIAATGKDDIVNPKTKNIRLYVKRVFISDDFDGELFPRYLSFVKGVVDSNDLPLNVSREILQESRIVRIMRKRLVRKAFDMILGISMSENREDYEKFWDNFGKHLKSEEDMISLDEYVENMKPEQKDIYFIASDSITSARNTPFLERLLEKDLEVLFLEDLDLGDKNEEKEKIMKQEFGQTCDWIKKRLGDKSCQCTNIKSLELITLRACVWEIWLVCKHGEADENLTAACRSNQDDEDALRAVDLLYDAALVSSGYTPEDPAQLGGKIYEMMGMALSGKWSAPPEVQHPVSSRPKIPETLEAELIEPVEVDGQK
ncbi:hypothetical protein OIU76_005098 [Salix suchowensis]|nr:hypothetical protein OIU76_005098 [Salix suchowensis]